MKPIMLCTIVLLSIVATIHGALNYPNYDESGPHACQRPCEGSQPMVCEYYLDIEWYLALSKACYDCPFNVSHCDLPHCVPGDGLRRPIISVNRRMPGPLIEVCEGDTIKAVVHNNLLDGQSTSMHWHGIHQRGTPYMDGAGMVTQCLISYGAEFTYEFAASPSGTHFYHSHTGFQRGDGMFGGLVVHPALPEDDPHYDLYDHDCTQVTNLHCEYVVHLHDMAETMATTDFVYSMFYSLASPDTSTFIEGRNVKYLVANDTNPGHTALTPRSIFTVQQGKRYRFRVINAGNAMCAFKVSIDAHTITLIAADGSPLQPVTVDVFAIYPGETYDFVVNTVQAVDNYWFKSHGLFDCLFDDAGAIVRYEGAPNTEPVAPMGEDRRGYYQNAILSDLGHDKYSHGDPYDLWTSTLRYFYSQDFTNEVVDTVHFTGMDFYNNDFSRFNDADFYPPTLVSPNRRNFMPNMDNISFHIPSVPVLSQPGDFDFSLVCNRSSVDAPFCKEFGCSCTHVEEFELNRVIELIIVMEGVLFSGAGHPMHLHGYNFRVMGIEKIGESTTVEEVMALDAQGLLQRNFDSPMYRDTVVVPDGSYVIIRIETDNPGFWFFHCHIENHVEMGQGLLLRIGGTEDLPPVPQNFPRCGPYLTRKNGH